MKVVGRVMLFLNCASCFVLKESNTFSWPAKSTNKKRLVLAKLYASVLRVVGGGWVKDERNSVEKTLMLAATMSPNITVYGYKQTSINTQQANIY